MQKPLAITAGEPAGIGYDILVQAAQHSRQSPWLVFADPAVLVERAQQLGLPFRVELFKDFSHITQAAQVLTVWPTRCAEKVIAGKLNVNHVPAVAQGLTTAAEYALKKDVAAMVTLPVHKGVMHEGGMAFTGHTEFLANIAK